MSEKTDTVWCDLPPEEGLPLLVSHLKEANIVGSLDWSFTFREHEGLDLESSPSDSVIELWNNWLELREQDSDTVYSVIRDLLYNTYIRGEDYGEYTVTLDVDKAEVRVRYRREERTMSDWMEDRLTGSDTIDE